MTSFSSLLPDKYLQCPVDECCFPCKKLLSAAVVLKATSFDLRLAGKNEARRDHWLKSQIIEISMEFKSEVSHR